MGWKYYLVCECGNRREAWRGDRFFADPLCPKCGAHKDESQMVIARWNTSKITWWNPLTWKNGYWEEK